MTLPQTEIIFLLSVRNMGQCITVIVYKFQNLHQLKIFCFIMLRKDFDILLLDIEMGAMELASYYGAKLRQDNHTVQLYSSPDTQTIFLTDMAQMPFTISMKPTRSEKFLQFLTVQSLKFTSK